MFVLVAYKPSSFDTESGYNVSSECLSYHSLTEDELLLRWAQIMHDNVLTYHPERLYYVQIFQDSKLVWNEMEEQEEEMYDFILYKRMIEYYDRMFMGAAL